LVPVEPLVFLVQPVQPVVQVDRALLLHLVQNLKHGVEAEALVALMLLL
jgi:hypothetical protein